MALIGWLINHTRKINIQAKHRNVKVSLNEILCSFKTKGVKVKASKDDAGGEVEEEKLRILVRKSRTVYGVCDQARLSNG